MATPCLIWIGIREPASNKYSQVKVEKIVPARDVGFAVQMKNQKKDVPTTNGCSFADERGRSRRTDIALLLHTMLEKRSAQD